LPTFVGRKEGKECEGTQKKEFEGVRGGGGRELHHAQKAVVAEGSGDRVKGKKRAQTKHPYQGGGRPKKGTAECGVLSHNAAPEPHRGKS